MVAISQQVRQSRSCARSHSPGEHSDTPTVQPRHPPAPGSFRNGKKSALREGEGMAQGSWQGNQFLLIPAENATGWNSAVSPSPQQSEQPREKSDDQEGSHSDEASHASTMPLKGTHAGLGIEAGGLEAS